jgi:glutaredoxin
MTGRDFRKAMAKQRGVPETTDKTSPSYDRPSLQFFTASWCGACNQARAFLKKERIPYVEYDVEKNPQARRRLQAVGTKNGLSREELSSVPIFLYGTKIMTGFSPDKLRRFAR